MKEDHPKQPTQMAQTHKCNRTSLLTAERFMFAIIYFWYSTIGLLLNKRREPELHDGTGAIEKRQPSPYPGSFSVFNINSIAFNCNATSNRSCALQLRADTQVSLSLLNRTERRIYSLIETSVALDDRWTTGPSFFKSLSEYSAAYHSIAIVIFRRITFSCSQSLISSSIFSHFHMCFSLLKSDGCLID